MNDCDIKQILDDPKASTYELREIIEAALLEIGAQNRAAVKQRQDTEVQMLSARHKVQSLELELSQRDEDIRELQEEIALMKRTWLPPVNREEHPRAR